MTALAWEEMHPIASDPFWQARLTAFALYACDESWRVMFAELDAAHGPAANVEDAKRAAEAWLRAHLHDLLRQLRDPNMGSDYDPPGGPLSEESRAHAHGGFEAAGVDRRDEIRKAMMPTNMIALRKGTREVQSIVPFILGVSSERRAPVQGDYKQKGGRRPGTISWEEHLEAWRAYHAQHPEQDAEAIARRQGFSYDELVMFLGREPTTWRPLR